MRRFPCVGAGSRRIVEVASAMNVPEIVASRRQVDGRGGYTGMTQVELVAIVHDLSDLTRVVRDHGGPGQGGKADDGVDELDDDVMAGFDGLHLDVSALPPDEQIPRLIGLMKRFDGTGVRLEVGGEHDGRAWNAKLLEAALTVARPYAVVVDTDAYVWADQQVGRLLPKLEVFNAMTHNRRLGVRSKAHNMDWLGARRRAYVVLVDDINVAPEVGAAEVDAILHMISKSAAERVLDVAYESERWRRWYYNHEGTRDQRARTALRYLLEIDPEVKAITTLRAPEDWYVRKRIRHAIAG